MIASECTTLFLLKLVFRGRVIRVIEASSDFLLSHSNVGKVLSLTLSSHTVNSRLLEFLVLLLPHSELEIRTRCYPRIQAFPILYHIVKLKMRLFVHFVSLGIDLTPIEG